LATRIKRLPVGGSNVNGPGISVDQCPPPINPVDELNLLPIDNNLVDFPNFA